VFSWRVDKLDGDGINLSTHVPVCQGRVGTCGYILSCQALNVIASRGPNLDTYLVLENPRVWPPGGPDVC
jgi:hypothetical protein